MSRPDHSRARSGAFGIVQADNSTGFVVVGVIERDNDDDIRRTHKNAIAFRRTLVEAQAVVDQLIAQQHQQHDTLSSWARSDNE